MRAAASWNFGQVDDQGNVPWRKSDLGVWMGNPSVSPLVSRYMTSLKRRKVTQGMLQKLYDYNHDHGRSTPQPYGSTTPAGKWDGAHARLLCWVAYLIAFHCLLRVDEVLNIQAHDVRVDSENPNIIIITLPFRKTAQYGKAHLCPVRAYAAWIEASEITHGYLFRKIAPGDRIVKDQNEPMTSADFLEMFRNHLIDIGVDPYPYGTHSFRRGGCQYLHIYRRWTIHDVCQWGGWSVEFSSLTIVKYLISWNDSPVVGRRDFFNPNRPLQVRCSYCGRTCNCA
ncbi:DNA breaking-rejoining enzyme [Mycena olivaceomarginata]|nr:DNA breaking-rejoining enzyme [Mycena olivaceomarginata]